MRVLENAVSRAAAHPSIVDLASTLPDPLGVAAKLPPQQRMVMKWTTVGHRPICHWQPDVD